MSYPEPMFPRLSYAFSRRCARRCFFLRPSRLTNQILGYCLGYVLLKFVAVRLTAFAFMSNHAHFVISSDDADLSAFFGELNALIARAMNCTLGRGENFWSSDGLRRSGIFDERGLWEQLVYCAIQPTKDGLVPDPNRWPGLISSPEDVETKTFRFERPDAFFRSEGDEAMPEFVEFQLELPVELEDMDPAEFRTEFRRLLDDEIATVLDARARAGKPFLGRQQVLDQDPRNAAGDTFPDRGLTPRVVCHDKERRPGILRSLSQFRFEHSVAWFFWSRGQRDVEFPYGTYWMRVKYNVRCRDPVELLGSEPELTRTA